MEKLYFIVNPKAKNGNCLKTWEHLESYLKSCRIPFMAFFTEYPGHAKELAGTILKKEDGQPVTITAVGGDGTMHEVVNGIAGSVHVTVGFIPGGSGNDYSRGFKIPKKPSHAFRLIAEGGSSEPMEIDLGKIEHNGAFETYFMNNMGAGFDAVISKEANESKMKKILNRLSLGRLVYAIILVKNIFTYRCFDLKLTLDGQRISFGSTWFVTVSNQPYYGGGMKIAPAAQPDDGYLDVTVVENLSRMKLLLVFLSVFWGKHIYFKEVKQYTARKISIETDEKVLFHADGEVIGHTPMKIAVCPKSLKAVSGYDNEGQNEELKDYDCN